MPLQELPVANGQRVRHSSAISTRAGDDCRQVDGAKPVTYRSCDSEGAAYHFCPVCGSTVYYEIAVAPDFIGVRVGAFADPTFPPPMISGFEAYRFPWAMNVAELPMPGGHHD